MVDQDLILPPSFASGNKTVCMSGQVNRGHSGKMTLLLKMCQAEVGCVQPIGA